MTEVADDQAARDAATDAFEDLRDEVAALRATISEFPNRVRIKTPDYTPSLTAIQATLEAIEGHPALQLTPETYLQLARVAADGFRRQIEPPMLNATNLVQRASAEISRFAGDLRSRRAQWQALGYAAGAGMLVGAVAWGLAVGPLVRALPPGWRVPERMAVAVLNTDRAKAGWRLMQFADPSGARDLALSSEVWAANKSAFAACWRQAARQGRPQVCKVTVGAAED